MSEQLACPTCGATRFAREDTIVKGSRELLAHVDDGSTIHVEDESFDWEVEDSQLGMWTCWPNGHELPDDMDRRLELAADNA